jgi:coproporphyrinogen III oxidase-like Fe-S oxidoreductase
MLAAGYVRTSAWCFSRKPGMFDEYIVERNEYLGLGSGAFSYLQGSLYASTFSINHYLRLVDAGRTGTFGRLQMTHRDQMRYYLLMQLFGGALDKAAAEQRFGGRFNRTLWPELTMLQTIGAVTDSGVQLRLTEKGYYLWVMMMREFFTGVNNLRDQMRHNISRETVIMESG